MVAFYVLGTQVFPGQEVLGKRDDFFRDHRVGDGAKWFSLCPHGTETRGVKGTRKVLVCRECGQTHFAWTALESRTFFLPGTQGSHDRYDPLGGLVIFHEADQPLPGKFLIGLPPDQGDSTVVLWRIIIPETNGGIISAVGPSLYQNSGAYTDSGHNFHVLEMLALVSKGQGMTVSTSTYRSVLLWNGSMIDINSTQRTPHTVDS